MEIIDPQNLTYQLPRDMFYQVIHNLRRSLPPPVTNAPEDLVRRDNAAIAQVACLLPANADEADLAVQYIAASAQALDSLRLARENPSDVKTYLQCTAQSASMMRQSRGARSMLIRVQEIRQKREANNTTLDQAEWVEHCAIGLMADALGRIPPAPIAEPSPAPPEPTPQDEAEPQPDPITEADRYAIIYPRRAALIRAHGGLPPKCDFGRPEPYLEHAIVTGTSPILRALDTQAEARA